MRISRFKLGGLVMGAIMLAAVSTGCQRSTGAVFPPAAVLPTSPAQPSPEDDIVYYEADQDFVLINDRPVAMYYFLASPSDVNDWEDDILDDSILLPGESATITIGDGRESCTYDFLAVFEDDSEREDYGVDICNLSSYTFN